VRYLIISDIHGNIQALDAVLADAGVVGYDAAVCLGDLVGYGADPGAVIARVIALAPVAIVRGNHDKVCAGLEPAVLFNEVARRSVEWTRGILTPDELQMLTDLPKGPRKVTDGLEICHGSPFDEDHYVFDRDDAARSMEAITERFCLFGHTHLPAVFTASDDPATTGEGLAEDEMRLPPTGPALINVGSVGQPRDGDPRAAYGIIDLTAGTIRLRRTVYDIRSAQKRIMKAGLPQWLALRLEKGQ
jgi:diadenosine tetraphosphatase ApaH/serine/threonine PP2A family protein phosphatase